MKKLIAIFIIVSLFINIILCSQTKAVSQSTSTDINSINTSKYPGIKEKIKDLQKEHPNWEFKILYTGIDWKEAIANEYTGHGSSPKNLVPGTSSYAGDWICSYCGNKIYDSGSWKCASVSAIKYMMDPRASLNSSDIFQFLELSYSDDCSKNVLSKMLEGSFLDNWKYIEAIMDACEDYDVNPYYIAARILQEQGKNGTVLTKGKGYNGQYSGYYNVFNIGAYGSGKDKVILNGLAKAKSNGWTSLEKSIDGGIKTIANSYIAVGQNTMYFQKFDVENSDGKMYNHQYMQNILAAQNEGTTLRKTLASMGAIDYEYTFIIPVYENMPSNAVTRPSTTSKSKTSEIELVYANVSSSLRIRDKENGSKTLGYLYSGEIATRLEKGSKKVNGTYWDKVLKSNGTVGYVARCTYDSESNYKEYIVSVYGDCTSSSSSSSVSSSNITTSNTTSSTSNGSTSNTSSGSTSNSNTKNESSEQNNNSIKYSKGDINEDGKIDSADLLILKRYLLKKVDFSQNQKNNANLNGDDTIDSADLLTLKKYLLGKIKL